MLPKNIPASPKPAEQDNIIPKTDRQTRRGSPDAYEQTRERLIETIHASLTDEDKAFLLSVKNVEPDWGIYDFEKFPAVQWKLQNLQKLKDANPDKHREQYQALKDKLTGIAS
jgi:hypothetical protein